MFRAEIIPEHEFEDKPKAQGLPWFWTPSPSREMLSSSAQPMVRIRARVGVFALLTFSVTLTACGSAQSTAVRPRSTPSTTPGLVTVTSIRAHGLTFIARETGPTTGQLVILLHGFPQSSYE